MINRIVRNEMKSPSADRVAVLTRPLRLSPLRASLPPPQGAGPAGPTCGSIGPGAWRGGSVSGPQEGSSRQEAPGGAPPRRGWAPPAGLWGPQGLCPFLGSTIGLTSRVLLRLKVDLYTLVRARLALATARQLDHELKLPPPALLKARPPALGCETHTSAERPDF